MACLAPQCTAALPPSPFESAKKCAACGKRMGYLGGRRGFGLRQRSHWDRCRARARANGCDVVIGTTLQRSCPSDGHIWELAHNIADDIDGGKAQTQQCIEEVFGDGTEVFNIHSRQVTANYSSEQSGAVQFRPDVDAASRDNLQLESPSQQLEGAASRDILQLESPLGSVEESPCQQLETPRKLTGEARAQITESDILEILRKHFTQIKYSKTRDGIEPIHMQYLKEVAMQGSLPALSDLFVQREKIVMEVMQENESLKSQLGGLMNQHGIQTSELLSLNRQSIAQRICSNAAFGDLAKMQKERKEQVAAHDELLEEHEKMRCENHYLRIENHSLREASAKDKLERETDRLERENAEMLYDSLNRDYEALIEMNEVMQAELEEFKSKEEHKQTTIGEPYQSYQFTDETTCYEQESCLLANQLY